MRRSQGKSLECRLLAPKTRRGMSAMATYGTVFKLTQSQSGKWNETVLHSFTSGRDGGVPYSELRREPLWDNIARRLCPFGCGTVFKITP
jgi:hypothetical protein